MLPENELKHELLYSYSKEHKNFLKTFKKYYDLAANVDYLPVVEVEEKVKDLKTTIPLIIQNINNFFEQVLKNPPSAEQKDMLMEALNYLITKKPNRSLVASLKFSSQAVSGFHTFFYNKDKKRTSSNLQDLKKTYNIKKIGWEIISGLEPEEIKKLSPHLQDHYFINNSDHKNNSFLYYLTQEKKYKTLNTFLKEFEKRKSTKTFTENTDPDYNLCVNPDFLSTEDFSHFLEFVELINRNNFNFPMHILLNSWYNEQKTIQNMQKVNKKYDQTCLSQKQMQEVLASYFKNGTIVTRDSSLFDSNCNLGKENLITPEAIDNLAKNPHLFKKISPYNSNYNKDTSIFTIVFLNLNQEQNERIFSSLQKEKTVQQIQQIYHQIKKDFISLSGVYPYMKNIPEEKSACLEKIILNIFQEKISVQSVDTLNELTTETIPEKTKIRAKIL